GATLARHLYRRHARGSGGRREGEPMDAAGKGARISDATLLEEVLASRKELSTLTDELAYAHERAAQAVGQKERLAGALQEARDQITALTGEVHTPTPPPATSGL